MYETLKKKNPNKINSVKPLRSSLISLFFKIYFSSIFKYLDYLKIYSEYSILNIVFEILPKSAFL